jgi:hypothetical protein
MGSTSCTGRSFSALTHILTQPNKTRSQLRAVRLWEATLSAFGELSKEHPRPSAQQRDLPPDVPRLFVA